MSFPADVPTDVATLQALLRAAEERVSERDARLAERDAVIERKEERISRIESFCRLCIRWMMFKSHIWITPLPPLLSALGVGSHGSGLSENYAPNRLTSE